MSGPAKYDKIQLKEGDIMILVKCGCKCFYTLDMDGLKKDERICPNCGKIHRFNSDTKAYTLIPGNPVEDGIEIISIPDDAKISIDFNVIKTDDQSLST